MRGAESFFCYARRGGKGFECSGLALVVFLRSGCENAPLLHGAESFPVMRGAVIFPVMRGAAIFPVMRGAAEKVLNAPGLRKCRSVSAETATKIPPQKKLCGGTLAAPELR